MAMKAGKEKMIKMEETSSRLISLAALSLSSKSISIVVSNDDLLTEILSYVPARRLICLKLVNKQWLSLITSQSFALLHHRRCTSRTSALFLESQVLLSRNVDNHLVYVHLNLDQPHKNPFRHTSFLHDTFDPKKVCILQSCHGLLLCRTGIEVDRVLEHPRELFYYYIYNPTTNQLASIDIIWSPRTTIHVSVLDFDPFKSPHYKVVFCLNPTRKVDSPRRCFSVYNSETMTWKISKTFVPPFALTMCDLAYFKGSIYWISPLTSVDIVLSYNVDEERVAMLPKPPKTNSSPTRRNLYFGESAGHLHVAEVFSCAASSLDVYQLNSDCSGWFLKFKVDLDQLSKDFPEMTRNKYTKANAYAFSVLSLVRRRDDFDEDSVLVLELPGKVIVYNLVHQSWKVVRIFCQPDYAQDWNCGVYKGIDYKESLACVTKYQNSVWHGEYY